MTILLKKDGRLIIDADQPLEGVSLDNLAAILSGANDGDVIQYDATNGMWVNKSAPSSLPEVTASDKGKYLKANESTGDPEWASGGSSGGCLRVDMTYDDDGTTLNKTWKEIVEAIESGALPYVYVGVEGVFGNIYYITEYEGTGSGSYKVVVSDNDNLGIIYTTDSKDGYPKHQENSSPQVV